MRIQDILRHKGSGVISIGPDRPVREAIRTMVEHNIGAVLVYDGSICGILTERDLLRAADHDLTGLATLRVEDLMTRRVVTARPDASTSDVMHLMTERRIRHLPVVAEGTLYGMISIGDIVNAVREQIEAENRELQAYIGGGLPM
jgi:CBS domain-containing protein